MADHAMQSRSQSSHSSHSFRSSHSFQWLWIAVIWSGLGIFDATQNILAMRGEGMHHAWARLFFTLSLSWLPWAMATPLVLRFSRQFPLAQRRQVSVWAVHLSTCVAIGLATAACSAALEELLNPWATPSGPGPFAPLLGAKFYNGLLADFILYGGLLLTGYAIDSRERAMRQQIEAARLNEQLSKAQLSALRRQIEPHFLFNALNAIAGLVREKRNDDAVSMLVQLSDFLRRVTDNSERQQVPLSEELAFASKYLEIQKVRFPDRLQVRVEVPQELLPAQVPSLILQPMVENAVKHGISKRVQGGMIRIAASRVNGTLKLSVYNDGPALPRNGNEIRAGIGMSNVQTRLHNLYGSNFQLALENWPPDGVEAWVSVPFTTLSTGNSADDREG